jgi:hypothetical protein
MNINDPAWLSLNASPAGSSYSIAHLVDETPAMVKIANYQFI